jgi:hypothetical protein
VANKDTNRIDAGISPDDFPFSRFSPLERESLRKLATSRRVEERRLCVDYLWLGIEHPQNYRFIVEICDILIPDKSQYVRWQTLLLVGRFAEHRPELIWPLVVKWGSVKSEDIRQGIACCALEHIFEHHFTEYFKIATSLIKEGNHRFKQTLGACWKFGQTEKPKNAKAFDSLLQTSGR